MTDFNDIVGMAGASYDVDRICGVNMAEVCGYPKGARIPLQNACD